MGREKTVFSLPLKDIMRREEGVLMVIFAYQHNYIMRWVNGKLLRLYDLLKSNSCSVCCLRNDFLLSVLPQIFTCATFRFLAFFIATIIYFIILDILVTQKAEKFPRDNNSDYSDNSPIPPFHNKLSK